ncbi:hypothetical protein UNPF46_23920 [Bradyrhizobium sp. UNPF46]|nr:hypothetical protein UNPF46_23920 [Bradyrhizobium sp. UNPF46]
MLFEKFRSINNCQYTSMKLFLRHIRHQQLGIVRQYDIRVFRLDYAQPTGHRFVQHNTCTFKIAWKQQTVCALHERSYIGSRYGVTDCHAV